MSPVPHTAWECRCLQVRRSLCLIVACPLFICAGGVAFVKASSNAIPAWRVASFLLGMSLIWAALGSPLAAYDHDLLTVHMIQHLLLMTFAPALIWLGEPLMVFWHGLPRLCKGPARSSVSAAIRATVRTGAFSAGLVLGRFSADARGLACAGIVYTGDALGSVALRRAGFVFGGRDFFSGCRLIRPWPSASTGSQWSTLLYLFLATLPCDILSGFLVFSDRVVYPVYFSMPRHFGLSVLEDQQCAAALMWTCVTLVYLVPAAILSARLLSPRRFYGGDLMRSELRGETASDRNPQRLEAV